MAREMPVPKHRASRLLKIGRLLGGVAGQVLSDGVAALASGKPLRANDLLLTPANAIKLAERLSEMRGAAMKVGQLLSMEAGDYLPPALTEILATLRENAHPMPRYQLEQVLESHWGKGWGKAFKQFSYAPIAAASIGQVHQATTLNGQHLAIKVQYPGVRQSIDSDVDNVATLLSLFRLIPADYDLAPLLREAKQHLHQEADYRREADNITAYSRFIANDAAFELPTVDYSRTTADLLSMSFVSGTPIETLAQAPVDERNRVATQLLTLVLQELFEWGLVQTDAQFGNYRYQAESGRIGLLDFGATHPYSDTLVEAFRHLISAAVKGDITAIEQRAIELGYLRQAESLPYRQGFCRMIQAVAEPVRQPGEYDIAASDLAQRVAELAIDLRLKQRYMHLPPTEMLFLHRKIGGTYLLCARLRAKVDINRLVSPYIE